MSFGIFLVRQYVMTSIPDELLEAARVDGAGELWIFLRIVLPLMRGPLGALAVLAFFQAWTAFAWPLVVMTNKETYTLEVGLALFQTGFTVDIGRLSAAAALALVPERTVLLADASKFRTRRGLQRLEGVTPWQHRNRRRFS